MSPARPSTGHDARDETVQTLTSRRTKIVATLGPATREPHQIGALIEAGVDVFRLNFAHADPATHAQTTAHARAEAAARGRVVGILVDLPGPKMRTGPIANDRVGLDTGARFVLSADVIEGDGSRVSTTVGELAGLVSKGDEMFLADGQICLRVADFEGPDVVTEVVRGGVLRSRKGMHIPSAEASVEAFTPKDHVALKDALALEVDFIGLSFIRNAADVTIVRDKLPKGAFGPQLVAKIETAAALDDLDGIVGVADGVMVARGDLGIQTRLARVPVVQKQIIAASNRAGVPVITATQMLESMTRDPLPTRAEVADVANAVLDGTDALMLSEETAIGEHPVAAVTTMIEIALQSEDPGRARTPPEPGQDRVDRVSWAVAHAAIEAAEDLDVAAILCPTRSGATARRVAAFRPRIPIVGLASRQQTLGELALLWGVTPLAVPPADEDEGVVDRAVASAQAVGLVRSGDLVAVVAGTPGPRAGQTDFVRIIKA